MIDTASGSRITKGNGESAPAPHRQVRSGASAGVLAAAPVESGSVKTPVLQDGVSRAEPLSTDTNSVYLFFLHQSGSVDKVFAVVKNNKKRSNARDSPEENIGQRFCPGVTC